MNNKIVIIFLIISSSICFADLLGQRVHYLTKFSIKKKIISFSFFEATWHFFKFHYLGYIRKSIWYSELLS